MRGRRHRAGLAALACVASVGAGAALTGCANEDDGDCVARVLFGPNFDCGGPRVRGRGDACWADAGVPSSGYYVEHHTLTRGGGLSCEAGTYCHPARGCQPQIAAGRACIGLPDELLWGMCADEGHGCYPADPEAEGGPAGPRICRRLPATEGAFCDASIKPDCDAYPTPDGGAVAYHGPMYAWQSTAAYDHPEWSGDGYAGRHLGTGLDPAENHYPALRVSRLLCREGRCVPPPGPGEPCAELGDAAAYPASGPHLFACAQPPEFVVSPATTGAGFGAQFDVRYAVHCIDGRCTPAAELAPDTCFAPDGAAAPLDPTWCSSPAETCRDGSPSCLSPCRADGRCGMCRICVLEDGQRVQVDDEAACAPQGGAWKVASTDLTPNGLFTDSSRGPQCGFGYTLDVPIPAPLTGELWLEFGAEGAFLDPAAAFDVFLDGAFLERWSPGTDCQEPGGAYVPMVKVARRLDESTVQAAADGRLRIEFRGTEAVCATCRDPAGCPSGRDCRGNELVVSLQNRTRQYLGLLRDDRVCPDP